MKDKLILAAMIALFIVAAFFMVFNYWLVQKLGYYSLAINAFFGVCFIVLFWRLKLL